MCKPVAPGDILRCVLYDMLTLGLSIEGLRRRDWPDDLRQDLFAGDSRRRLPAFYPREMLKICALTKFRALYWFLYCPPFGKHKDEDLWIMEFAAFGYTEPLKKPAFLAFSNDPKDTFSIDSISKYIEHLTKGRITKEVPQPKFEAGNDATIRNSELILKDAKGVVDCVLGQLGGDKLCEWSKEYLVSLERILNLHAGNTSTPPATGRGLMS